MIDKTEFVITSQNFNLCLNCPAYEEKEKLYVFCIINAALQCVFTEQMLTTMILNKVFLFWYTQTYSIQIKNGTIRQST